MRRVSVVRLSSPSRRPAPRGTPDVEVELVVFERTTAEGSEGLVRKARADPGAPLGGKIRSGLEAATGEIVLLEFAPPDVHDLGPILVPLLSRRADLVLGIERARSGDLVSGLGRSTFGRAPRLVAAFADVLSVIPLSEDGIASRVELVEKLARSQARIETVPIDGVADPVGAIDLARALAARVRYRLFDDRFTTHDGLRTLGNLAVADGFNRSMMRALAPHMGTRILEAGSGIGTLSRLMLDSERLILTDLDPLYLRVLEHAFGGRDNVRVQPLDLQDLGAYDALTEERIDTVLCVNVLEHVADDLRALEGFYRVLEDGGRALIVVPQGAWLFGEMDRAVGHHRRYDARDLERKLARAGFSVEALFDFNPSSTPGWFVNGRILKKREVPSLAVRVVEVIGPIVRRIEPLLPWPGLSLIAVGRKGVLGGLA